MAFNKLSFVATKSREFTQQRSTIVEKLSQNPSYASIRDRSERKLQDILTDLTQISEVRNHSVMTVCGSYAFGMASDGSDFDGAIFLKGKQFQIGHADNLERTIDMRLSARGLTPNMLVITEDTTWWMASRDSMRKYFSALGRLIVGRPLTNNYDIPAISQLIPDLDGSSRLLTGVLEGIEGFITETSLSKYQQRLEEFQGGGRGVEF